MSRRLADRVATAVLWAAAIAVLLLLALFIGYIIYLGAPAISWHFLTAPPSEITAGGGVGPEIYNSFYILVLTLLFTAPIAISGGIYLQEYARDGVTTNGIESVWAVMKRGLHGVYHHASAKHMHRYVDEFTFRLNEGDVKRHTLERLDSFIQKTSCKRLTYKGYIQ